MHNLNLYRNSIDILASCYSQNHTISLTHIAISIATGHPG